MTRLEAISRLPNTDGHAPPRGLSIGQYLIRRLQDYGIKHVFGIPGDYMLTFYGQLEKSPIKVIGCTREDSAGFAADAYARINGMGAVCVTYCVGGLSVCNSIAGAYAEKSPVVVLTGSPGLSERVNNPLLHHKVRDFRTQLEVFEKITVAAAELTDPVVAFREIDRVLDAVARYKRPGYIEIPRDMVDVVPHISHAYQHSEAVQRSRGRGGSGQRSGRDCSTRPRSRSSSPTWKSTASACKTRCWHWPSRPGFPSPRPCWARA